jgi:hypothetical protein
MHPAITGAIAVIALGGGFAIGYLVLTARQHTALERLAAEQQSSVQLYLRRKVAETGVDIGAPPTGTSCEEVLAANVTMATALLAHDRRQIEIGDTQEFGLASTVRLQSTEGGPVSADLPDLPKPDSD